MTNISKRKLPEKEFDNLYKQFNKFIGALGSSASATFFNNLLGKEEKVMLVKRLASVVMYIEGNSSYRVWQLLQLSPSTAEKIRLDYERGRYKDIEALFKKRSSDYKKFWETLDLILRAGLPPRGRGRWNSVLQNFSSHK